MGKANAMISEAQELQVLHHHALEAAEQTLMFVDTHATMVGAAVLILLTSLVIACACRARWRGAAVQEYIYTSLLHREDGEGQESLFWERLAILKELLLQLADIVTDVMWSASMLGKGHVMFGLLNLFIIAVASIGRFVMERLSWKRADVSQEANYINWSQQKDDNGNKKPGPWRLLTHLLQLNVFQDGWQIWHGSRAPAWSENLVLEGVLEGIPSFVLQVYTMMLLHEVERMNLLELVRQLTSNVLSLRTASIAMNRLNQGAKPRHSFGLILFRAADLGSRLLTIVLTAVVMRPARARLHEAHQGTFFFALLISAGATLVAVYAVSKKHPKTVLLKSFLCCFFGIPYLSVPEGCHLYEQRRLRTLIVLLHYLEAILVNVSIWSRWGTGQVYGDPMALLHISHLLFWLVSSCVLLADEACLQCLASPLLPTGREWQTLEWASALGIASMAGSLVHELWRFDRDRNL